MVLGDRSGTQSDEIAHQTEGQNTLRSIKVRQRRILFEKAVEQRGIKISLHALRLGQDTRRATGWRFCNFQKDVPFDIGSFKEMGFRCDDSAFVMIALDRALPSVAEFERDQEPPTLGLRAFLDAARASAKHEPRGLQRARGS
jgi:hypothetical protein